MRSARLVQLITTRMMMASLFVMNFINQVTLSLVGSPVTSSCFMVLPLSRNVPQWKPLLNRRRFFSSPFLSVNSHSIKIEKMIRQVVLFRYKMTPEVLFNCMILWSCGFLLITIVSWWSPKGGTQWFLWVFQAWRSIWFIPCWNNFAYSYISTLKKWESLCRPKKGWSVLVP